LTVLAIRSTENLNAGGWVAGLNKGDGIEEEKEDPGKL
jgi:hypothetical protein